MQPVVMVVSGGNGLFAQQPAAFILGEEQFSGVQIYDVIQDAELNYLFATNEGLFLYDYYTYKKIDCDKAKGSSVFGFVENGEGVVYCHNLNNQIFRINGGVCTLFHELREGEAGPDISIALADNGDLLVGAKQVVVLDKNGNVKDRYRYSMRYLGAAFTRQDKAILFHLSDTDSVICYSEGKFSKVLLHIEKNGSLRNVLNFYHIGNKSYALDLGSKNQYCFDEDKMELTLVPTPGAFTRSTSTRIYETGDRLWVAGTLPGVVEVEHAGQKKSKPVFYGDYFISNVFKDKEGNVLLCTFDKGVLVVPDLAIPDVIHSFRDDPVTSLLADGSLGVLLGTSKGKVLTYKNGTFKRINEREKRPVTAIYGSAGSNLILFDDGRICVFDKRTGKISNISDYSLKDAIVVSDDEIYLGTNGGLRKVIRTKKGGFIEESIKGMDHRVYFTEYDPATKDIYVAASNGLFLLQANGALSRILHQGKDIFPTDMRWYDSKLLVSTNKLGILFINKDKVLDSIKPIVNGETETLKKIRIYKNTLMGVSVNGFYQFDLKGKLLRQFHSVFGFSSKRILDFALEDNICWISHSGGVQAIDPGYKASVETAAIIRIDKVTVNNEEQDRDNSGIFGSDQRKISFLFSSPTLRGMETTHYHYKLEGYEKDWTETGRADHEVTYNALGAGSYIFIVRAENNGMLGKPVTYAFSIASPLYVRWWFITIALLLFLTAVFLMYRRQLNIQRRKAEQINELNASKLAAIQSQMNPHFIFNSLNSVQDLILKGDVEHSYTYITMFSDLVRRTLNYSEKDFIDFEQEIRLLELYLSLEKLRFKKDLEYEISAMAVEDIMIPPLLVQPFIENALVHGLLHKEGIKRLKITFELKDVLICTIEDNGIGREKARAIRQRQRPEHESFSGRAIRKRFEILSGVFGGEFGYVYEDLYEGDQPGGTRVRILIPVKHTF